jgi:hypothetical protein
MKESAEVGLTDPRSLALPYNNLAAMYKLVGKSEEAREYAEIAASIAREPSTNRKR